MPRARLGSRAREKGSTSLVILSEAKNPHPPFPCSSLTAKDKGTDSSACGLRMTREYGGRSHLGPPAFAVRKGVQILLFLPGEVWYTES